jgi:hypothetical protein
MAVRRQRAARAKVAPEIEREILRLAIAQPASARTGLGASSARGGS